MKKLLLTGIVMLPVIVAAQTNTAGNETNGKRLFMEKNCY